jgi:hypothetical protein
MDNRDATTNRHRGLSLLLTTVPGARHTASSPEGAAAPFSAGKAPGVEAEQSLFSDA